MANERSSPEKRGLHGEKELESGELAKKVQQMHAEAAGRDEGGRASVSDAQSGEQGLRDKGWESGDDVIDPITRRS